MKRTVNVLDKPNWPKRACAVFVLSATMAIALPAQTLNTLFSFDGTDGAGPGGWALVQGTDGDLYGTTQGGGAYNSGTVFKITTGGELKPIYSFCPSPQTGCPDGEDASGLVQATNGDFYGTTQGGGANGGGTVFRITARGKLTTLYNFCSQTNCVDGKGPGPNELVQAANGDFYGITGGGGDNAVGTVFKITPGGTLTTLYSFCSQSGCADGSGPVGGLVQATNGDLYGTTWMGGASNWGTVSKITPTPPYTLTTLYSFSGSPDSGELPSGTMVQATNGDLYGTTSRGTIFRMTPGGTLTTIGTVCCYSYAGLVQATDGNLYGTTIAGGPINNSDCEGNGCGTIFKITPAPPYTLTTLYNLCSQANCTDGAGPGALMQATNGNIYGTTAGGGAYGDGTVFSLGVELGPFVETRPTSGKVGETVIILGNDLTGTTEVSFNSAPATFTVNSSGSAVSTTVPAGATTGFVTVTTPTGTLKSNVPFRVRP